MRISLQSAFPALLVALAACASDSAPTTAETTAPTQPKATVAVPGEAGGSTQATKPGSTTTTTSVTVIKPAAPAATTPAQTTTPASTPTPATASTASASKDTASPKKENAMTATSLPASFYGFKTTTLEGKPADLSSYKGKVVLVVNTASQCGLTPQYTGLEKLHADLSAKGFSVLGFPSNDFGGQEPGTPAEIRSFCDINYKVTFPLFSKVQTKDGEGQSPIYTWLKDQTNQLPRWNFGKYLIGKDGKVVQVFDSKITPEDPALRAAIDKALGS